MSEREPAFSAPYAGLALASAWALSVFSLEYIVWSSPAALPGRMGLYIAGPIILGFFTLLGGANRIGLLDLQSQLGLREKFALFLVHVVAMVAHVIVVGHFWLAWSAIAVLPLLLFFLQRQINFNRLVVFCAFLWFFRLMRRPDDSPAWLLAFMALILLVLVGSHYFTLYQTYYVEHGERRVFVWKSMSLWMAGLLAAGGILWWVVPPLTPTDFTITVPPPGPHAHQQVKSIDWKFMFQAVLWTSLTIGLLYFFYWIRTKFRSKPPAAFEVAKATIQRMKEELDRTVLRRWRANLMNPADQVIAYYNMFCERMHEVRLGRETSMTPSEYRGWLGERSREAGQREDDLAYMTDLFERALYAADDISSVDSRHFQKLADEIVSIHKKHEDE